MNCRGLAKRVMSPSSATSVAAATSATFSVPVTAGSSYLIEQPSSLTTSLPFAQVTGVQATVAKHLGNVQIGLDGGSTPPTGSPVISLRAHANSDYVTADNAGASPLIANRTAIGPWESFDLITN